VSWRGVAAVELATDSTRAVVVPELGMLVASFAVDGFDHVARPGGVAAARAGHTTGATLLSPWANRLHRRSYRVADTVVSLRGLRLHTDDAGLPMHGTMIGRSGWDVAALGRGRLAARYDFAADPEGLAAFPFPHMVRVSVRVGRRHLRVDTAIEATGDTPVPISFGWHPYLRVPGARDEWSVALPFVAHARLDRRGIPTGRARAEPADTVALAGRAFDDLFAFAGDRAATLVGGGRRLTMGGDERYPYLQVFAPPGRPFCCLEPMTAPTDALVTGDHPTILAGATFEAAYTLTVS
jgi:galactose mutarotase-like enzyme